MSTPSSSKHEKTKVSILYFGSLKLILESNGICHRMNSTFLIFAHDLTIVWKFESETIMKVSYTKNT